ncbi:MAG: cell division protein ZapA [Desulfobacterales bacterium]|nr:cell division protein ZapA [Desulfobacterales bacterium]
MDNIISVQLLDETYKFKTECTAHHAEEIVKLISDAIADIPKGYPNKTVLLLLAAMSITSKYCLLKNQVDSLTIDIHNRIKRFDFKIADILEMEIKKESTNPM